MKRNLNSKSTFALCIGNRGLFPASLLAGARDDMSRTLKALGHQVLMLDPSATRHGAVETPKEGRLFADFLQRHRGKFDGVILCLPNFGDENGAVAALKDSGVPILIQAYPDQLDKMAPELRRDAFCGKFSIMDVFCQHGVKFTSLKPHTVHPEGEQFAANIEYFDRLCRITSSLKNLTVGAIGARTTAFKTVRIDELTLQRYGVTVETFDLSDLFSRIESLEDNNPLVAGKTRQLNDYTRWDGVPERSFLTIAKMGVAIDRIVEENQLDALAIRCWIEMQEQLGISPCVLLSEMNDRGLPAACELDIGNAVIMTALSRASGTAAACLDWNNNYAEDPEKCILFHCGSMPQSMMREKGRVTDHEILKNSVGPGRGYGCNVGRIAPMPMTFGSLLTEDGKLKVYLGEGRFTDDPIPSDFFGCAGVAHIGALQDALQTIGQSGFRHHVSVTEGHLLEPAKEALAKYLGYEVTCV